MNLYFSPDVRRKINERHDVEELEVEEAFYLYEGGAFLVDDRKLNRKVPPTLWFIGETAEGRVLKIVFIYDQESDTAVSRRRMSPTKRRSRCMKPTPEQERKWGEWAAEDGDAWDRKELGADPTHAERAPSELEREINESLHRKRMIAIRLPQSLIDSLKELAAADSIGYQTYIRQVLARHVREQSDNG